MDLTTLLSIEEIRKLRSDPNLIYGPTLPVINSKRLKEYPEDYNPILEYWQQITSGKTVVSKKIYKQYKEIVSWIENDGYKEWFYSSSRANHIIEFAENYCHHSKGKLAGKKVVLELWEKAYLASVYGFIDIEGNRKHQRAVLIVGKKNGKSLLDSIMGLYGLVGDGEGGPEIYAVATKKDQAKIVWQEAKSMVKKSPALRKRVKTLVHELDARDYNDGIFKALASDSDSLDGLNIHVVIMDEWHQWKNGRALYDIMADGITARDQPLIIMTSTAGKIREDIYDEIYEEAEIQLNNYDLKDQPIDDRSLFFVYELDSKEEWKDPRCWIKANPGLGTIKKLRALYDKVKRALSNSRLVKNLVCKEFNIRETASEAWLSFDVLDNRDTFNIKELKPRYGIGGIDLSATTDLTCATLIFKIPNDEKTYVKQMYFLPGDLLEERVREDQIPYDVWEERGLLRTSGTNKIDYKDITKWFLEIQNELDCYIYKIGYDRWGSTYLVDELKQNFGVNTVVPVAQGAKTFSSPMRTLEADLKSKLINYNNNPITKWNLSNAAIKTDTNNNITLVKTSNPKRRIDGVASLMDALIVLEDNLEDYLALI